MSGRRAAGAEDADFFLRVDREGVFLTWGAGLNEVFGYAQAEVLGRSVDFLIPPKLRPLHHRGFNRAVATGRLKRQGKIVYSVGVHKDGRLVPFRAVDILEFGEGGVVETVGAVIVEYGWRSITQRLRLVEPPRDDSAPPLSIDSERVRAESL